MSWITLTSKKKVDFPLFKVFKDRVKLPNGFELDYYRVEKTPVSVILPIISDKIVMVNHYRYPIKSMSLELPAGHIQSNETPKECALRELKEETGFKAGKVERLLSYNPSTEYSDLTYYIFIAKDLKEGKPKMEKYEIIDIKILNVESVIDKIMNDTITDGRTISAIFLAKFLKII